MEDVLPSPLPVLPVRNAVLFPLLPMPLNVGRKGSLRAVEEAVQNDSLIVILTQREPHIDEPGEAELYRMGTLAKVIKVESKLDGGQNTIVQGLSPVPHRPLRRLPAVHPGGGRAGRGPRAAGGRVRDRRPAPQREEPGPEDRQAVPEHPRRGEHVPGQPRQPGQPGRHRRRVPEHPGRPEAGHPRGHRRQAAPRGDHPPPQQGARDPRALAQDPVRGEGEHRQVTARVLPARAAEGDPEGARREGARERDRGDPRGHRRGPDARARAQGRAQGARSPGADEHLLPRVLGGPDLPRLADRAALGERDRGQARSRGGPEDPGPRPLRPGEGQEEDPGVPRGPQAQERHEGPDPLLLGPSRRRQDLPREVDRQGPRTRVRPHQPGRDPGRGGDPGPPPDLRGCPARPHHPGDEEGRHLEPHLHARRDRQGGDRLPGGPLLGPPRGPGPGAER